MTQSRPSAQTPAATAMVPVSNAVAIKQASVRLTALLSDEQAWEAAGRIAGGATTWAWANAGAQLGRIGEAQREVDPASTCAELLAAAPSAPQDEEEYGFDASGAVLAHREWTGGEGPRTYAYDRSGEDVLVFRWDLAGERAGIELLSYRPDGRLAHAVDVNAASECFAERYAWRGDHLDAVELLAVSISSRPQARRVRVTDRFVYAH